MRPEKLNSLIQMTALNTVFENELNLKVDFIILIRSMNIENRKF